MSDDFGDARLEELEFLTDLSRRAGRSLDREILAPSAFRDMVAWLVREGYVNDLNTNWIHDNAANAHDPNRGVAGQTNLERQIHQERIETLSRVLCGQSIHVQISHYGRVRISALKQDLGKDRIKEGFGILWDKRHLETDLRIALLQASDARPLSVVFMDMNGLKQINDSINHDAGDAAIKAYFHTVEALLGERCDAYCAGGDEVVVIMGDHNSEQTCKVIRSICQELRRAQVRVGKSLLPPLTISAGIVTTVNPTTSVAELRQHADEAMYVSKAKGKTCDPRPSSIAVYGSGDSEVELI